MGRERKKKKNQRGAKNSSRTDDITNVHNKIEKGPYETSNSPKPKHVVKLSFSKQKVTQHPYIIDEKNISTVVYMKGGREVR